MQTDRPLENVLSDFRLKLGLRSLLLLFTVCDDLSVWIDLYSSARDACCSFKR
ncbi:hypothetical protein E5Q_06591 [Mixia osmundae IAM 14324]|uniref:Uncharacterized protein n=1 Tax=Mixia osmundae (strain CBS 9802 / IAM 14324 / JCM 22182 / KY 12970) TaxID=764103 RepID=G7EAM8_MIXOS|nr:hypothetical protein E5Q_06591 [Mixia osmundae IAM 14324]